MKKSLLLAFTGLALGSSAQSTSPEVISASGGHFENATMQMSWTAGEVITETITDGSTTLTQGFHQTNLSSVAIHELDQNIVFQAFPNPVLNQLSIEVSEAELGASLELIDAKGSRIFVTLLTETSTKIDFTTYESGTYFLNLITHSKEIGKTFKIQKMN